MLWGSVWSFVVEGAHSPHVPWCTLKVVRGWECPPRYYGRAAGDERRPARRALRAPQWGHANVLRSQSWSTCECTMWARSWGVGGGAGGLGGAGGAGSGRIRLVRFRRPLQPPGEPKSSWEGAFLFLLDAGASFGVSAQYDRRRFFALYTPGVIDDLGREEGSGFEGGHS